jgi:hypothetical protein
MNVFDFSDKKPCLSPFISGEFDLQPESEFCYKDKE